MIKKILFLAFLLVSILSMGTITRTSADSEPALKKQGVAWDYGTKGLYFNGYVPALDQNVSDHAWELYRWTGVFNFADGGSNSIQNYDVFNVKKMPSDTNFDKENGFGLVVKSESAVEDFYNSVWKSTPVGVTNSQMNYYRNTFKNKGSDYDSTSPYYYSVNGKSFLRTAGIVQRMGAKYSESKKISDDNYEAHFDVSPWPTLQVTLGDSLQVNFGAYGYSERNIRIIAASKGAFPNLTTVVSLTDGKLINTSDPIYEDSLSFNAKDISKVLGKDVDIIIEDGYGRTMIKSVTLSDNQPMDYIPTKLTLTKGGQLWIKFRYDGDEVFSADYTSDRGIPMTAAVKIGGAATAEFTLPSMYSGLPTTLQDGQVYSYMLGKIEIGDAPGKYYIKVDGTVNNPNHPDRGLESPSDAYQNNSIHGEWLIERKAAKTDLIAVSITASPTSIQTGGQSSISAKVKNDGVDEQSNVLIRIFDNATKIYEVRKSFASGQTQTVGPFDWTGTTTGVHSISVHVDPDGEKPDKDRTNNVISTGCSVAATGGEAGVDCNKPEDSANWTVSYPLITGYHVKSRTITWTDADGKSHSSSETYTDYSDPIWENRNVQYQENLKVTAEVNTRQGVKTDLAHPKESDRDSRGSWEIIPYANKSGKNANAITRAGYGIELKVQTVYTTDWETKVPIGLEGTAWALGGHYYGPDVLYATFYDSKWKFERKVQLEKTSGNRNMATWELPLQTFSSESGKSYQSRKYMTSVNAPDGYYRIKISSDPSGLNGLVTCITKQVEIWGSMYDDVQNIRRTN